jgi:hypothetical protein
MCAWRAFRGRLNGLALAVSALETLLVAALIVQWLLTRE